jgi:hypothetical protein
MGWLGKLLATPVRLVNAPLRAMEKLIELTDGDRPIPKEDRILSAPLGALGDAIEEAVDGEDDE